MVYGLPLRIRKLGDPQQADRELADAYRIYLGEHVEHAHVASAWGPRIHYSAVRLITDGCVQFTIQSLRHW